MKNVELNEFHRLGYFTKLLKYQKTLAKCFEMTLRFRGFKQN